MMKIKKNQRKVETYGRVRDRSSIIRVVLFVVCLIVFIGVLTIARDFIVPNAPSIPITRNVVAQVGSDYDWTNINLDGDGNFDITYLSSSQIVEDLPKKAVISLQIGDDYYVVEKGSIRSGRASDPDISIALPVEYVRYIPEGLCSIIERAEHNGELWIEEHSSTASLLWKYKSMLKYRDCLGI